MSPFFSSTTIFYMKHIIFHLQELPNPFAGGAIQGLQLFILPDVFDSTHQMIRLMIIRWFAQYGSSMLRAIQCILQYLGAINMRDFQDLFTRLSVHHHPKMCELIVGPNNAQHYKRSMLDWSQAQPKKRQRKGIALPGSCSPRV